MPLEALVSQCTQCSSGAFHLLVDGDKSGDERELQPTYTRQTSHAANRRPRKLVAVASGGGHWVQLLRLAPAFAGCKVVYVTVHQSYRAQVQGHIFYAIPDATRWGKVKLIRVLLRLAWIMLKEKPEVIISTGAAPGYFALRLGRFLGAKTIWIDSIANAEELSLSGLKIGRYADLWLTQWPHLARSEGPHYAGSIL